jgi:hypothetical protein
MKTVFLGLAAMTAAILSVPALTATAEAHPSGKICRYQTVDRDDNVRTRSNYCHHLPQRYRNGAGPGFSLFFSIGDGGWYFDRAPRYRRGQDQVCLVTFFKRSQVAGGADANVARAQVLPRYVANRRDGPNDRMRIFDYGTNAQTRKTCRYLNNINN